MPDAKPDTNRVNWSSLVGRRMLRPRSRRRRRRRQYPSGGCLRVISKAITWNVMATLATALIVWLFTRDATLALGIGALDAAAKMILYVAHERAWRGANA